MMEKLNKFTEWAQDKCLDNDSVAPCLYDEYGVSLGLRDETNKLALSLEETDVMAFLYEIFLSFNDAASLDP